MGLVNLLEHLSSRFFSGAIANLRDAHDNAIATGEVDF
jgi:hypothetical protein